MFSRKGGPDLFLQTKPGIGIYIYMYMYIYMFIFICICIYICLCMYIDIVFLYECQHAALYLDSILYNVS